MHSSGPPSPTTLRRSQRLVAASLIALALASGCASQIPPGQLAAFEPQAEYIALGARNPIVCAPTAIGNAAGALVGYPLALITLGPALLAEWLSDDDDLAFQIYGTAFWIPVLLTGAATGAVFLPMSYAIGEHPCDLGVSTGWKEPTPAQP
jgi:hypothetical protein